MANIGEMETCHCGARFKKKTKWHDNCCAACKNRAWIVKKSKEITDEPRSAGNERSV